MLGFAMEAVILGHFSTTRPASVSILIALIECEAIPSRAMVDLGPGMTYVSTLEVQADVCCDQSLRWRVAPRHSALLGDDCTKMGVTWLCRDGGALAGRPRIRP